MEPLSPPPGTENIFSISDAVLAERLQFQEEIGFGNWGSVWLCTPRKNGEADDEETREPNKVAVKLVHRNKTKQSAARVKSLWNEMKIVRAFSRDDPHPSIVPFHSFIITPSFAMITMEYLPTLIPVEVSEPKAIEWFRALLSGIAFLHSRGVVHNDIKPANILLNTRHVPVLVDFGFAEKYDIKSTTAFHTNLNYGTPEYLSPERAKGLPHDARKSDCWSAGITFFEILTGRTPFEHADGEQFTTKEELEKYWARTLKGKWLGTWNFSIGTEKFLKRLIAPNADLRCTAAEAQADPHIQVNASTSHKRSLSVKVSHSPSPSVVLDRNVSKLLDISLPWNGRKERESVGSTSSRIPVSHTRAKSQPKNVVSSGNPPPKKRVAPPPIPGNLSTIKDSPVNHSTPAKKDKENRVTSTIASRRATREPLAPLAARKPVNSNVSPPRPVTWTAKNLTAAAIDPLALRVREKEKEREKDAKGRDTVRKRIKEWEREKERLQEAEAVGKRRKEIEDLNKPKPAERLKPAVQPRKRESEDVPPPSKPTKNDMEQNLEKVKNVQKARAAQADARQAGVAESKAESTGDMIQVARVAVRASAQIISPSLNASSSSAVDVTNVTNAGEQSPGVLDASSPTGFRYHLKMSLDKSLRLYKSSALARLMDPDRSITDSVDGNPAIPRPGPPGPSGTENGDRFSLWIQGVNMSTICPESSQPANQSSDQSSLVPTAPTSFRRSTSSQNTTTRRLPRKLLAASEIFSPDAGPNLSASSSAYIAANISAIEQQIPLTRSQLNQAPLPSQPMVTPAQRIPSCRRSVEQFQRPTSELGLVGDASFQTTKFNTCGHQADRSMKPWEDSEDKAQPPLPSSSRSSRLLDPSMSISPSPSQKTRVWFESESDFTLMRSQSLDINHLIESPVHVEPYPPRKSLAAERGLPPEPVDTPRAQRQKEGVYDRFLMATTGVKRVGRGYQSEAHAPVTNSFDPRPPPKTHRVFGSNRRPMPPAVSSDDMIPGSDEFGVSLDTTDDAIDTKQTVGFGLRRALKAVTTGHLNRRLSKSILTQA